jgi:ubiquinone/menaquinone biosynthesis C-methylase UbiE
VGEHLPLQDNSFDFAILHDIIEHVYDPLAVLKEVHRILVPGGSALVAFVPWYSPYGGHTWIFLPVPWGHLFYSKKVLAEMRSSVAGWHTKDLNETGLYKVSLIDFHQMIERSGFDILSMRYMAIRNKQWLTKIRILRELTTAIFAVQLVKNGGTPEKSKYSE